MGESNKSRKRTSWIPFVRCFFPGCIRSRRSSKSVAEKSSGGQTPISRRELAEKIIADALPVRFQIQQHKIIWPPEQRGV
jgi:hypothetical protein